MVRRGFRFEYAPIAREQLRVIERKYHALIRRGIERLLKHHPDRESKNRKPLTQPASLEATWECRFGPQNRFRVFYEVDYEGRQVMILAIGEKRRNRLRIGGEEFEL